MNNVLSLGEIKLLELMMMMMMLISSMSYYFEYASIHIFLKK